ncbi:MAG: hypothetical protein Kow0069_19220 [Promethearchaeota archaeon]
MKKVLVTGAGGPAGNNVVRSLRSADEPMRIYGTDINPFHLEYSRELLDGIFLVPRCTNEDYLPRLNQVIDETGVDLVHPQPDVEVKVISENRERLHAKTFLPSKKTIATLQDKFESARVWEREGFPTAKAVEVRADHLEEDLRAAFDQLGNELWIRAKRGAGGTGSTPASNPETAIHWIRYWQSRGRDWEFIAQEKLPGRNLAFQSVWNEGELVTSQARERLEYIYPYLAPSGVTGTPVVARTIHDERVNKMATKAVLAIDSNPTGVFCVDLKEDSQGNPVPTEINAGRFFTTSYFYTAAGLRYGRWYANMPYLVVKLAAGDPLPGPIPKYDALPAGVYWIRHIDCGQHLLEEGEIQRA